MLKQFVWCISVLVLVLFSPGVVVSNESLNPVPPQQGIAGADRSEFERLYRDDLPYARYIRAIADQADNLWPTLDERGVRTYDINVYRPLKEALQLLSGDVARPEDERHRRYIAISRISEAFESSQITLPDESREFHREVFESAEFRESDSTYRDVVIDLWRRFEAAGEPVPYRILLGLNQPGTGRAEGQSHFYKDLNVGELYCQLGEHQTAARWYEKVPPVGLGPLKAADAYYLAEDYAQAERYYRHVLENLDGWMAKKPELQRWALRVPLMDLDPKETEIHVRHRLAEIAKRAK